MIFETISGSTYEINMLNKTIRRLAGSKAVSNRQSPDGEWQEYESIFPESPVVNSGLLICWTEKVKPFEPGNKPATLTSTIVSIKI